MDEIDPLTEAIAEYLYGHPRAKAIEWAKLDKFESRYIQAQEILEIIQRFMSPGQNLLSPGELPQEPAVREGAAL